MNDLILSALTNLFALCGTLAKNDRAESEKLISTYLKRFFGIRSTDNYVALYNDLRDLYETLPNINEDEIIDHICKNIQNKVLYSDQVLMLLRLMEFTAINPNGYKETFSVFQNIAKIFHLDDELFNDFDAFVTETPSSNVKIFSEEQNLFPGFKGRLRVMQIKNLNKYVFSYYGNAELFMNDVPVAPGIFMMWEQSSVLKGPQTPPIYFTNIREAFEDGQHKTHIQLTGRNINFRFKNSDNGLHNFSFTLNSGDLVAIMGGSGVGKTTLLSLLNGNLPPQSGSVEINGYPINHPTVRGLIGFVPQDDLLIEELTVYQNLWYTSRLCFAGMSNDEINKKIDDVLSDLGLIPVKNLVVGSPLNKTISGGQRKRLNIALELIREPAVLFLDEPTSGLSSSDSEKVINLLKEQTYRGRLVVVNIHQPSSDIYKLFDRLWLLDKGGYPVYDGNPIEAITYFKQHAFYADENVSTCVNCGNVNPEIVLNIIDEKMIDDNGSLTDVRKISPQEWNRAYETNRGKFPSTEKQNLPENKQHKPSVLNQFLIFLQRNIKTKIANRQYLFIALLEAPLLALIVALLTRYAGEDGYSLLENKNLVSYIFMAIIVATFLGMSVSAEEIIKDRALLKRERFLQLNRGSYLWSKIVFLFGLSIVQTALFILVGNAIIGIHDLFLSWWLILFAVAFLANLTGLLLSQTLNSIVAIYISIPLLLIPQILLCGLVVKFEDLNAKAHHNLVPVLGDVIPSRWAFEALVVEEFSNNNYQRLFFDAEREKFVSQYYQSVFVYQLDAAWETARDKFVKKDAPFDEKFELIRYNLPCVAEVSGLPLFAQKDAIFAKSYNENLYTSLQRYFAEADSILNLRSYKYTVALDRKVVAFRKQHSAEALSELKNASHNTAIEKLVLNTSATKLCAIRGKHIVPKIGAIYLDPENHCGRAAFYSHVKILGNWRIPTFYFNLGVLFLMMLLTGILLFKDIPGRWVRE